MSLPRFLPGDSIMRILKWVAVVLGVVVLGLVSAVLYFKSAANARLDKTYDIKVEEIPMPFPLTPREIEKLRSAKLKERAPIVAEAAPTEAAPTEAAPTEAAPTEAAPTEAAPTVAEKPAEVDPLADIDLEPIARSRAIARGKRYVESRAACTECHGEDFGGKVVMDNPAMGTWVGPNITRGGVTANYTSRDWVRLLRHGVKPNGKPATMPSMDFTWFSDQEISDIAMYINSVPKVETVAPPSSLGPIMAMLIARGKIPISAEVIDHDAERARIPPRSDDVSLELGKHLATTCTGCHGPGLSGGKIEAGDPSWLPARNLTFHETGLATWTLEQFTKAMREGVRPDGAAIGLPMPIAYTKNLNDSEIESLYDYLKSLPLTAYGNH
jgi:cytochrome c553